MARAEYQGCPPGVVRGAAAHPSIASALNHTVKLPRRRRPASYAGQFVTLCVRLGMWWRRSWFSLKGKAGTPGSGQGQPPTPGQPRAPSSGSVHQGGSRPQPGAPRRSVRRHLQGFLAPDRAPELLYVALQRLVLLLEAVEFGRGDLARRLGVEAALLGGQRVSALT